MYIQAFGRVTAPQLSHISQSFKVNSKNEQVSQTRFLFFLEVSVCVCAFERGLLLISSSFCHIKTVRPSAPPAPPHFFFHSNTDFHCNGHPLVLCGETQPCTLCFSLTETSVNQPGEFSGSFRKIQLPFNKRSAPPPSGRGQGEARKYRSNAERNAEMDGFQSSLGKKAAAWRVCDSGIFRRESEYGESKDLEKER